MGAKTQHSKVVARASRTTQAKGQTPVVLYNLLRRYPEIHARITSLAADGAGHFRRAEQRRTP